MEQTLRPAALAFNAVAPQFETRFGAWHSVAAQRRAVRRCLARSFPPASHVLEIGGGTGEDAAWLAERGRRVLLTDAAPAMVAAARARLTPLGSDAIVTPAEDLDNLAEHHLAAGGPLFDGAFSNFAPLNCVENLSSVARGLGRLVRPGGSVLLVLFGTFCPGEMLVEALRGRRDQSFRRLKRGPVAARLGGQEFPVTYHRATDIQHAMVPWFRPTGRRGIGVFVPPSAAEPWISQRPALLATLEAMDRVASPLLAPLGDHVLYRFERRP